jgi:hypothetical protein
LSHVPVEIVDLVFPQNQKLKSFNAEKQRRISISAKKPAFPRKMAQWPRHSSGG